MMIEQIPWLELCLALGPALVALALYELVLVRPLRRRLRQLAELCAGLEHAVAGATGLSVRVVNAERRARAELRQLGERLGQLELRSDARPYEQAISLAEKGEHAERLVSCFGLTEGEASLVRLLHGDRHLPPSAPSPGTQDAS
jgi:hypothetical protein